MYLKHLSLTNYRAFNRLDMDLPRRILLLQGDNAQGKTSMLEAVYYLAAFTSYHTSSDKQLINFLVSDEPLAVTRLVADYQAKSGAHRLEVRLIQQTKNGESGLRREILVDGVKRTAHEAFGCFTAVMFLPQMTYIIEGGPEERRRYLNLAIAQAVPGYAKILNEYNQALSQRNALLKQLSERGGDVDQLSYWDELLAQRGAFIIHARISAISELEYLATRIHHRLTHTQEILRIVYQPAYNPIVPVNGQMQLPMHSTSLAAGLSCEEIHNGFKKKLLELRGAEINRGQTAIGPHRDEIRFMANSVDVGNFGSRGQVRTVLISLKLAEVAWIKEKTGDDPVLLLDEILVELDIQRRADLLEYLESCEQALLTTTDRSLFAPEFIQNSTIWWVEAGRVRIQET